MNQLSAKFKLAIAGFVLNAELEVPVQGFTVMFGSSGSGKTTIANLLPRFYDHESGAILLDDSVENSQQLAHAGGQGDFFIFPASRSRW